VTSIIRHPVLATTHRFTSPSRSLRFTSPLRNGWVTVALSNYGGPMRIVVTNDDGFDSVGLDFLADAMRPFGDVVIVAPDSEYSGAGAALGPLHLMRPDVHRVDSRVKGINEAWTVAGPPALCVLFARLGLFGAVPDLVVSGINPGANVGRSVYHSGTIGAALTARGGRISGIAVSQDVASGAIDGQGWDDMLLQQKWATAAHVAAEVVRAHIAAPPLEAIVLNVNVPNLELAELRGWRYTSVAAVPPRTVVTASLEPKLGHTNAFKVTMEYGEAVTLPEETDGGAVAAGYVSICALSKLSAEPVSAEMASALTKTYPDRT
jgi:5'-nucleotidase